MVERSPLEVRGWVSGLNFVVAGAIFLIGLSGLLAALGEAFRTNRASPTVVSNFVVGLGVPLGLFLFRRTVLRVRQDLKDESENAGQP